MSKRKMFDQATKDIGLEGEGVLSHNLSERVGNLEERSKITIRLDGRIIDSAKRRADELGVSYHKVINDQLLAAFGIECPAYLDDRKDLLDDILKRLERLEKLHGEKGA